MDINKIQEILKQQMQNLEVVQDGRSKISVDALNASKSSVSVAALRDKYNPGNGAPAPADENEAEKKSVSVKLVRPKDIGVDDPINAVPRAMIFKENRIEGFEG